METKTVNLEKEVKIRDLEKLCINTADSLGYDFKVKDIGDYSISSRGVNVDKKYEQTIIALHKPEYSEEIHISLGLCKENKEDSVNCFIIYSIDIEKGLEDRKYQEEDILQILNEIYKRLYNKE